MDLVDELSGRALFAIPKKGRLYEKCVQLLKNIDVRYIRKERLDIAIVSNFNLALVFLPAHDIALYVSQGRVDMGITGQDIVAETEADVNEFMKLGFGQCRLCLLTPKKHKVGSPKELVGKRIVTSFPELTKKYFQKLAGNENTQTSVKYVSGSVEIACPMGLAEGLVDLVESGTTINAAGLEILDVIMTTEAVLITNKHSPFQDLVDKLSRRIVGVITAEKYVMVEYNVERKHLEEGWFKVPFKLTSTASKITPGMQSPTVSPLEDGNWVAVKSMIKKDEANEKLDRLQEIGATAILITAIQNCRI